MSQIIQLQQDFQNYLRTGLTAIEGEVIDSGSITAQTRLEIYSNAYRERLVEALAYNFPCLKAYLGNEKFRQICLDYIVSNPSTYRSIRWYGNEFPDYLGGNYDEEFHFLAELAQFEWNMTMSFDAADTPALELDKMATIPPESWGTMLLKFHPSLYRMNFLWNIVDLWHALSDNGTPKDVIKNPEVVPWVLWRSEYLNRFYSLSTDEAWSIDVMLKGGTFGDLCEGLCQWHDEEAVGMRAASLLKSWIQSGFVTDILF